MHAGRFDVLVMMDESIPHASHRFEYGREIGVELTFFAQHAEDFSVSGRLVETALAMMWCPALSAVSIANWRKRSALPKFRESVCYSASGISARSRRIRT